MVEGIQKSFSEANHAPAANRWRWWMIGLSICGGVSAIAAAAFWWLTVLPPLPECSQISQISPDRDRLYCAQAAAESGELPQLLAGIDTLKDWTPDRPLYTEAQRNLAAWSEAVLRQAWRQLEHSDMDGAIALARRIPPASPVYKQAQDAIAGWNQHWNRGQAIASRARTAMRNQQWDRASEQIASLNDLKLNYWNVQAQALTQQVVLERRARQIFAQAKQTAQGTQPNQLGKAIALTAPINRNTFAWAEAQANLNQWSDLLLKQGLQQWQQGQLDQAIANAKMVEANPNLASEAQNLRHLSQARKLAIASTGHWKTSPLQIANLSEAVAAARQVKSNSRFYAQAQASLKSWQAYLDDLQQLQFAQATASLGHQVALLAAIEQATQIAPDRPCRLQAQTLIAHWKLEIERQADRPQLIRARQLAEPDTISALQQAIAQAKQIAPDRALRPEAQGLIYLWTQRIQMIEDQPILDRARSIARQGKLSEAIQVARQIRSGRSLSTQSRIAIGDWQSQIRARELARLRAIREREAARQRRIEAETAIEPNRRSDLPSRNEIVTPAAEPIAPPSRLESIPTASPGSISPPEQMSPRRATPPAIELVPPLEPPAAVPAPSEPAPPPVEVTPAAIEKPVPVMP